MKRVLRSQADFKTTTLRNQLTSLILFESLSTTSFNARNLVAYANRFFNRVKVNNLSAKKLAHETLFDSNAVKKTFEDLLPRFDATTTTFVRSLKTTPRHGDNAPMTLVMLAKATKAEKPVAKSKEAVAEKPAKKTTKKVSK